MALPVGLTTISVTGTYEDASGAAQAGSVSFTPTSTVVDATGKVVLTQTAVTAILSSGSFTLTLPCTDTAGLVPAGWGYVLTVNVPGASGSLDPIYLPSALGSTVDISALTESFAAPAPSGVSYYPNASAVPAAGPSGGGGFLYASNGSLYWINPANTVTQIAPNAAQGGGAITPTGPASGDLSGSYPSPTVARTHLSSALPILQGGTGLPSLPVIFVPAPSGDTSGVTDTAVIQALENAATSNGGTLVFAPGTYWVTGLVKQASTVWEGAGRFATIIKLANGSNTDVVQGANFATLTLSGSTSGGIGGWGIRDLTIDGNKTNQSGTSYGLRFYGYEFDLTRISIRSCLTDGIYSEWGNFGGSSTPDKTMEASLISLKIHDCGGNGWHNRGPHDSRAYDLTIFSNSTAGYGYWAEATPQITVAAGSNGVNVSTFAGAGTLNVSTTLGYPTASISATQGSLTVATSGVTAVITYTGVTATTFTGCTTTSGSGTLSTGGAVNATGSYSGAATLLCQCHVWGSPLWDYVLDTQAHLTDCVGEVAQDNGGMVWVRSADSQILGGYYVVYGGTAQHGCGIQIGDAANAPTRTLIETQISNLAGTSAATAAINIVNDGAVNSVGALIYQPSGTAIFGSAATSSRYRVSSYGASVATNAANSLAQENGTHTYDVGAGSTAWRIKGSGTDYDNLNTSTSPVQRQYPNGVVSRWYSDNYTTKTAEVRGDTGVAAMAAYSATGLTGATSASRYVGATASGAPVSGTFSIGDWVVDQSGVIWVCTVGGTSGTWVAAGLGQYLPLAGGTMAGVLSMNSHRITNVFNGSNPQDAAAFGQIPVLDATAADITSPAWAASFAGSTGKAADAGHGHGDVVAPSLGMLAWNYPNMWASTSSTALTSGVVYLMRIQLNGASISVTNVVAAVATAGSVLTSSQCFAGLYDNTGTKIGGTADQSGAWTSTGVKAMALTGGPFVGTWPFVYAVIISNGTTNPQFCRGPGTGLGIAIANLNAGSSNMPFASNGTGATALPGSLTYSSNSSGNNPQSIWVALS